MNRVTIEYECDGRQCVAVSNFESCKLYTDSDTAYATGGKDNTKLISFSTSQHLKIDLLNPSNISVYSAPIEKEEKEEEIEIDYVVVPEKPKKKRKRRKKKKGKIDNGRKTN